MKKLRWIQRFRGMPEPIVCPAFWKLQFAYGCPLNCKYCYLKGTFRYQGKHPQHYRDMTPEKLETEIRYFLNEHEGHELLNTGELADSCMFENGQFYGRSFSEFVIPIFEEQRRHKVLFLTKLADIDKMVEISEHRQTVISFSINPRAVAREAGEPLNIEHRIRAARGVQEVGYEVRIRIDPIIPIEGWRAHYAALVEEIMDNVEPDRVTLGSLRINNPALVRTDPEFWGIWKGRMVHLGRSKYRFPVELDEELFGFVISKLRANGYDGPVALCKERTDVWEALELNPDDCKCNCAW